MATCQNCGRELSGEERFCPYCGTPVEPQEAPSGAPSEGHMQAEEFEHYLREQGDNGGRFDYQRFFERLGYTVQGPVPYEPSSSDDGKAAAPVQFALRTERVGIPIFFGCTYDPRKAEDIWDPMNPASAAGVASNRSRSMFHPQEEQALPADDGMAAYFANMTEYMRAMYAAQLSVATAQLNAGTSEQPAEEAGQEEAPAAEAGAAAQAEEQPAEAVAGAKGSKADAKKAKKEKKLSRREQRKAEKALEKKYKNTYAFD